MPNKWALRTWAIVVVVLVPVRLRDLRLRRLGSASFLIILSISTLLLLLLLVFLDTMTVVVIFDCHGLRGSFQNYGPPLMPPTSYCNPFLGTATEKTHEP